MPKELDLRSWVTQNELDFKWKKCLRFNLIIFLKSFFGSVFDSCKCAKRVEDLDTFLLRWPQSLSQFSKTFCFILPKTFFLTLRFMPTSFKFTLTHISFLPQHDNSKHCFNFILTYFISRLVLKTKLLINTLVCTSNCIRLYCRGWSWNLKYNLDHIAWSI